MSLYITSLNSGSNGNCYYIANDSEAVLVDAGISCRETEKRMLRLGLSMDKVKALFISHEHSDHIRGVEVMSRKHQLPVYINEATLKNSGLKLNETLTRSFAAHEPVTVGGLSVLPFPKHHDASDPYSFVVSGNNVNIGVFTDIGSACNNLEKSFSICHAAFLESNYDTEMLESGRYPYYLKKRISGEKGHLSNAQALQLFLSHKSDYMSLVLLSHLSKENNDPELARKLFMKHSGNVQVVVASRHEETALFTITPITAILPKKKFGKSAAAQMSLF
ncbi:MAG: MBL fold metallo-hydrolase [Bacteroidetes bacterium]|nr:MBL fold metallo-hydrolase [Bacteroidota bacterium]